MINLDQAIDKAIQRYAETHPRPIDVTIAQACQMLDRTYPTVRKMIDERKIKLNDDGRIPITEIDKFSRAA